MSDDNTDAIMESLNKISVNVSECRSDIKMVKECVYGNGHPDRSLITRLTMNERSVKLLKTIVFFVVGAIITAATAAAMR